MMRLRGFLRILAALVAVFMISCANVTNDGQLRARFSRQKIKFSELLAMAREDETVRSVERGAILSQSGLVVIHDGDNWPAAGRAGLSKARWDHYQQLFAELRLQGIAKEDVGNRPGKIMFIVDKSSIWNGASTKGIVFSEATLPNCRKSLDDKPTPHSFACAPLAAPWYLYLFID